MRFASRKFIIAVLLFMGATALGGLDKMSGEQVMAVYLTVGGGYGLYNILDKKEQK